MTTYKLVRPEDLERLTAMTEELRQLATRLRGGPELSMNLVESQATTATKPEPSENGSADVAGRPKKYRIAKGAWKYADVVVREISEPEFSLDDAWGVLEPLVETKANRPRDGVRVGLDRDERFQRIDGADVRWRRVDPTQEEIAIDE